MNAPLPDHQAAVSSAFGAARADERLRPFHWRLLAICGLGQTSLALELALLSLIMPALASAWSLQPGELAVGLVANSLGGLLGATFAGSLADRFGRKLVFEGGMVALGLGALASAAAPELAWLALAQVLVGVGMGTVTPAMTTLVSELAPAAARGRLLSLLQPLWVVGIFAAAALGSLAVPRLGPSGAFLVGGLPLLYLPIIALWLPESPRSLLARGRPQEAARLLAELERREGVRLDLSARQGSAAASSVGELLSPRFRRRTLCMSALWFTLISSYNGFIYWLPGLLASSGFSLGEAYNLILGISLAQVPFVLATALLTDRFGRKRVVVPAMLLCAVSCVLLGAAQAPWEIVVLGAAFSATNLAGWAVMFAYTPEVFPTRLRARGVGLSSACGRVASLLLPLGIGALLASPVGSRLTVFLVLAAVMVFGALAVGILGEETHGRPLEAISS